LCFAVARASAAQPSQLSQRSKLASSSQLIVHQWKRETTDNMRDKKRRCRNNIKRNVKEKRRKESLLHKLSKPGCG